MPQEKPPPDGLDLDALDRHLRAVPVTRSGELRAQLIAGGRSNLTFLVADDATRWVLRRPPLHGLTPSAHDMGREYRVMAALRDTVVPVPAVVTHSEDSAVLGAPFQMVRYVPGRVIRTGPELEALGPDTIAGCVDALVDVLAALHAVDPQAVGLGDFGRPDGYLERQVRRWGSQWELIRRDDDPGDADVRRLHSALGQSIPGSGRAAIVHGDYRIDNTILDAEDATRVVAVLDWELAALGDPLSDAALMCVYRDPQFGLLLGSGGAAWASPVMPSKDALAHKYSLASGSALEHWPFYLALAYFKVAMIAAGIAFRGRMGSGSDGSERAQEAVRPFVAAGLAALSGRP